jgi:hypothetical protein
VIEPYSAARRNGGGTFEVAAVGLLGLAVVASDLVYILQYGLTTPYWDDWSYIPVASGGLPLSFQWLWAYQGDHRVPLPKIVFVVLYKLGGGDVRVIMLANLAILGAAAMFVLLALRRRSGRIQLTDALIPVSLVGIANYSNLVSANQIQYISSVGLFCFTAYLILRSPDWFTLGSVALVSLCAVCLPLTGSTGLALALPMVVLMPVAAWLNRRSRSRGASATRRLALLTTVALLTIFVAYNIFEPRAATPDLATTSNSQQFLTSLAQFASVGFAAPPVDAQSAISGDTLGAYIATDWVMRTWKLRAAAVLIATLIALAGLSWRVIRRPGIRFADLGLWACLISAGTLALAIAYERGAGLQQRYVVLGATAIVALYVCLRLLKSRIATLAAWGVAVTALALVPWNAYYAITFGEARQTFQTDLIRDIRAGTSVDVLGTRYYADIWGDPQLATGAIREMRDNRIGPFAGGDLQLNDAQPTVTKEETLSSQPAAVQHMTRVGDYWQGTGSESFLLYAIKRANLAGVRLNYSLQEATERPAYLQLAWSQTPDSGFVPRGNMFVVWGAPTANQPQHLVAWIGDSVDMLKVTPDTQAASFKLDSLVVLLSE